MPIVKAWLTVMNIMSPAISFHLGTLFGVAITVAGVWFFVGWYYSYEVEEDDPFMLSAEDLDFKKSVDRK